MTIEEAQEKICPFMSNWINQNHVDGTVFKATRCIAEPCMFWVNTVKGKKIVDIQKIPYDIYPLEEGQRIRKLENDGYVRGEKWEDRKTYIKYEDAHEGYCLRMQQ